MLPGSSGFRWIPRKMAGTAMITIEASIVAIVMLRVVLDRATHRYRSGFPLSAVFTAVPLPPTVPFSCPDSTLRRTLTQSTANHLLNGNYLFGPAASGSWLLAVIRGGGGRRPLEDVVDGDGGDQHERGDVAEQRDEDRGDVDPAAADEPHPGRPV